MDLFKAKLLSTLFVFGLVVSGGIWTLLYYIFPQFYPNWYFEIAFFFLIVETILVNFVVSVSKTASSKKMVNVYLLSKVAKIIFSLIFATVYILVVKENIKNFVLIFVIFYALYLGIETFLFSKIERHIKETKGES